MLATVAYQKLVSVPDPTDLTFASHRFMMVPSHSCYVELAN